MRLAPRPCMLCPTNIFTSSPSSTPCDRHQRSRILFWNYFNLIFTEKVQSCKYIQILTDLFSVLPKPFMWVDLLFGYYLIMLKAPPPSTTSLKESSEKKIKNKKSVFDTHSHTTLQKLCAWTSLEGAFVEREKFSTYHKLTCHITKPTRYSQLQSATYCC